MGSTSVRQAASWFNDRGWSAPSSGYSGSNRNFGIWSGLFLGALLSNIGRPGSVDFFHNNQNDPGYQQWRAEADRQAQDNADLREKLDELTISWRNAKTSPVPPARCRRMSCPRLPRQHRPA